MVTAAVKHQLPEILSAGAPALYLENCDLIKVLQNGTVKNISLIPDKEGLYFIDVELPKKLITSYHKEINFKHEMRASAEIITEDLRLIERFFYQFREVLKR